MKRFTVVLLSCIFFIGLLTQGGVASAMDGKTDNTPDWFYPAWAAKATFNQPISVMDTDSALGRYSLKTKEIGLKDLARMHGHLCDGMVIAFVEIRTVLKKLFPDGVVDRTDLVAVSKNGPCWVDTVAFVTGARINFQTLRIDNTAGDGFILQRVSTGEAYDVRLKPGVFPKDQADLEAKVRKLRSEGKPVTAEDINRVEKMADELSKKLLNTPPEEILEIKPLTAYKFRATDLFGNRGDIINKSMPR
jgi:formylmethanofuran dehydrogenase subunit E